MGLELNFGPRSSSDSQRCLHPTTSNEHGSSKGSLTRSERDDWLSEVDRAIGGKTTATAERTEVPFEHIRAIDNRQGV